jgi:hypothetical protein
MSSAAPLEVHALYSVQNGLHVFTSTELPGMVHANLDLQKAFESLSDTVGKMVSIKYGVSEHYRTCVSFDDFKRAVDAPEGLPVSRLVLAATNAASRHV